MLNVKAKSIVNNITDLENLLLSYWPHMVVMTDTWLSTGISSASIAPPGYKMARNDRGCRGGGVTIVMENAVGCAILDKRLSETLSCRNTLLACHSL